MVGHRKQEIQLLQLALVPVSTAWATQAGWSNGWCRESVSFLNFSYVLRPVLMNWFSLKVDSYSTNYKGKDEKCLWKWSLSWMGGLTLRNHIPDLFTISASVKSLWLECSGLWMLKTQRDGSEGRNSFWASWGPELNLGKSHKIRRNSTEFSLNLHKHTMACIHPPTQYTQTHVHTFSHTYIGSHKHTQTHLHMHKQMNINK